MLDAFGKWAVIAARCLMLYHIKLLLFFHILTRFCELNLRPEIMISFVGCFFFIVIPAIQY